MLTVPGICAKMSTLFAPSVSRSYNVTWEQLRKELLDLPQTSEPGGDLLLTRIRRLTGNLFWEDVYRDLDPQSAAAVYLFKKVADDVFFNFGQDSSVPLDLELEDGRQAFCHVDEVLTPLVEFVQASLSDQPLGETVKYLHQAAEKYLELVNRFSRRGRSFA